MYLRRLSYFVLACQQQGLAPAAAQLRITPSTLSAALKTLADEVGTPLFEHVHRRLHPSRAGLWLFRSALPILHAEEFARNWIKAGNDVKEPEHLLVDVKLSFALGRVSKAVGRAIQAFGQTHPHVFVEPRFADMRDLPEVGDTGNMFAPDRPTSLVIDALGFASGAYDNRMEQLILRRDPWVVVRNFGSADESGGNAPIIVPALATSLLQQLGEMMGGAGAKRVHLTDDPAGALPRMLHEHADATFLMPRSMAADRLGLNNVTIRPFDPEAFSYIVARYRKGDDAAATLAGLIRDHLEAEESNLVFHPMVSLRQLRYHQALCRMGSITAAARQLFVAQPALTDQLQKVERGLNEKLFIRSRSGLQPTQAAERLRSVSNFINDRVRRIDVESAKFFDGEIGVVRVGVIPSAGPGSLLLHSLAKVIEGWRERYPTVRLQVLEAQCEVLQEMVKGGAVNFALVERSIPELAKIKLAHSEPLSLVFDPAYGFAGRDGIDFSELEQLPLILPTGQSGLRMIIDEVAMRAGVRLNPRLEINSMPLVLEMLRGREMYTILPVSAVRLDIGARAFATMAIADGSVERQFYAIHSAERNLTTPERDFIALLKASFGQESNAESVGAAGSLPV